MKNKISEDVKRSICKSNNYETAKKMLDYYYYDQCGHIDSFSRDRDLERLFPVKVKRCFDCYYVFMNGKIRLTILTDMRHIFKHARYHDLDEVLVELRIKKEGD